MAKKTLNKYDMEAEREGNAIKKHKQLTPKNNRLKPLYFVDGQGFRTGEKKRNVIQSY